MPSTSDTSYTSHYAEDFQSRDLFAIKIHKAGRGNLILISAIDIPPSSPPLYKSANSAYSHTCTFLILVDTKETYTKQRLHLRDKHKQCRGGVEGQGEQIVMVGVECYCDKEECNGNDAEEATSGGPQ